MFSGYVFTNMRRRLSSVRLLLASQPHGSLSPTLTPDCSSPRLFEDNELLELRTTNGGEEITEACYAQKIALAVSEDAQRASVINLLKDLRHRRTLSCALSVLRAIANGRSRGSNV